MKVSDVRFELQRRHAARGLSCPNLCLLPCIISRSDLTNSAGVNGVNFGVMAEGTRMILTGCTVHLSECLPPPEVAQARVLLLSDSGGLKDPWHCTAVYVTVCSVLDLAEAENSAGYFLAYDWPVRRSARPARPACERAVGALCPWGADIPSEGP